MIRIQVLDPDTHTLIGIVWTDDDTTIAYQSGLVPAGYPARVDTPTRSYSLLAHD